MPFAVRPLQELGQSVLDHMLPAEAQQHCTQATPNFFWYSCQTVVNNFAPHYSTRHLSLPALTNLATFRSMVPKARCGRTGSSSIPQSHFRRTFSTPHTRVSAPVSAASDSPARLAVACSHRPPPLNYSAICTGAAVSRHGQVCGRRRTGRPRPDWCEFIRRCAAQM